VIPLINNGIENVLKATSVKIKYTDLFVLLFILVASDVSLKFYFATDTYHRAIFIGELFITFIIIIDRFLFGEEIKIPRLITLWFGMVSVYVISAVLSERFNLWFLVRSIMMEPYWILIGGVLMLTKTGLKESRLVGFVKVLYKLNIYLGTFNLLLGDKISLLYQLAPESRRAAVFFFPSRFTTLFESHNNAAAAIFGMQIFFYVFDRQFFNKTKYITFFAILLLSSKMILFSYVILLLLLRFNKLEATVKRVFLLMSLVVSLWITSFFLEIGGPGIPNNVWYAVINPIKHVLLSVTLEKGRPFYLMIFFNEILAPTWPFGFGAGNFGSVLVEGGKTKALLLQDLIATDVLLPPITVDRFMWDSNYISFIGQLGLIGTLLIALLLFWALYKAPPENRYVIFSLTFVFLLTGFTNTYWQMPVFGFLFWISVGSLLSPERYSKRVER